MYSLIIPCLIFAVLCTKADIDDDRPQVPQSWIYAMIAFGFIGGFVLTAIIIIASYKISQEMKIRKISKILTFLNFAVWIFNVIACFEWAFFRTDLFIELSKSKCTVIYISNYLFYMFGKYSLHMLLLYRLYLAFHCSQYALNSTFMMLFASIITIDFAVFATLWMEPCLSHVSVGVIMPSKELTICTLYNNDTSAELSFYEKIWPTLFGGQDFLVGIATLTIFIYKIRQLTKHPSIQDVELQAVVRKLLILGMLCISSTFVFYTFAIPFYPNLTFLLPFDAMMNGVCNFLLLDWNNSLYAFLCFGADLCLRSILKHKDCESELELQQIEKTINHSNIQSSSPDGSP